MSLSAIQLEQIRLGVLRHLDAAADTGYSISTAMLRQFIANDGYRQLDEETLVKELVDLETVGFIRRAPNKLSPKNPHWWITQPGRFEYSQYQS